MNLVYDHYPANNYFPPETLLAGISLGLIYLGLTIQLGKSTRLTLIIQEILFFFGVLAVMALATNAAQLTPFPTIDHKIIAFERSWHIDLNHWMSYAQSMPMLTRLLEFAYNSLPYQMVCIPLALILINEKHYVREYYFFLMLSATLGFGFYYFFPTTAPASMITSDYFTAAQHATALKFSQLHHHIQPTTQEGGLIALPSFHAIWAWYCLYILRGWPFAMILLMPLNLLLLFSCVLLGWHYLSDLLGAVVVVGLTHLVYNSFRLTFDSDSSIVSNT